MKTLEELRSFMSKVVSLGYAIDDTDPEQVRILKFIDKFKGKGWVSARSVSRWWTTKPIPSADRIRSFMSRIVSLNYAIDNGEPDNSAKYQIQILVKSTDNTDKVPVSVTTHGFNCVGHRSDTDTDKADKSTDNLGIGVNTVKRLKDVSTSVGSRSDNPDTLITGHSVDKSENCVGHRSDTLNDIQGNDSSGFVSIVSTFSDKKNLKTEDSENSKPSSLEDIPDGEEDDIEDEEYECDDTALNGDEDYEDS